MYFRRGLLQAMKKVSVGDPMDAGTELGPMAREDLLHELDAQVQRSVALGAELLCGGKDRARGFFYEPTVLAG